MTLKDAIEFIAGFLKPTPRQLVPIAVVSFAIAFMPDRVTKAVGIHELAQDYRPWFAIAFMLAVVTLAFDGCNSIIKWIRVANTKRKLLHKLLERLESLTEDEKKILRFYVFQETKTNILEMNDGVVQGLVSAGIIAQASIASTEDLRFPYNIQEMPWKHLNEHKSLLDGTTTEQRNDQPKRRRW